MILVPPIKCQGKKTKLVDFILEHLNWDKNGDGIWIEPFFGSGVVGLNVAPRRAIVSDINEHIIAFYTDIREGIVTPSLVQGFFYENGEKLQQSDGEYYYEVRDRFNQTPNSLDFLFLNRACFNGVMRFNSKGAFNVPFCNKPQRFTKSLITKICSQISGVQARFDAADWRFLHCSWENTLKLANSNDFVYADPPYLGRSVQYRVGWDECNDNALQAALYSLNSPFMLSTWADTPDIRNNRMDLVPEHLKVALFSHYYAVSGKNNGRSQVNEALIIGEGNA